jgi:hypothetical protein
MRIWILQLKLSMRIWIRNPAGAGIKITRSILVQKQREVWPGPGDGSNRAAGTVQSLQAALQCGDAASSPRSNQGRAAGPHQSFGH